RRYAATKPSNPAINARNVPTGNPSSCRDAHARAATSTILVASTATTNTNPLTGDDCAASIASSPDFRGGVVTVRCSACAAEQCPERQQYHSCRRHADTCSAQDVQGIVHPQVHPGPARQDGIPDPRRGERPGQERHERDRNRQGDGGVTGGKARAVRRLLAQYRVGRDLVGPGPVGN